jgi:16S rRNA (cytidine1402-2'-O)-methyltransferase
MREVLEGVDAILCEDTRVTLRLFQALGLERSLTGVLERSDQHASDTKLEAWVGRMLGGETMAFVSDAGTPGISDPGAELVAKCAESGVEVVVVPGPSALAAFLSGAGFTRGSPVFRGFFPRKNSDRETEWKSMERLPFEAVGVWFESPERISSTAAFISAQAPAGKVVFAKELTKKHERFFHGSVQDLTSHIQSGLADEERRGEWVFAVEFSAADAPAEGESAGWEKGLRSLLNCGVSASSAAREVSQVFGISRKIAYSQAILLANRETPDELSEDSTEE